MGIVDYFAKKIQKNADLRYGRDIIREFVAKAPAAGTEVKVLDLGAGPGIDLSNAAKILKRKYKSVKLYGVEAYAPNCELSLIHI